MKNVIITGKSGFLGSNLTKYLERNEFKIIGASREKDILSNPTNYTYSEITHSLLNEINIHAVIHAAGKAHDLLSNSEYDDYYQANYILTKKVFDSFLESNSKVFVFISSIKAVADHYDGNLSENVTPHPLSHYGKTKLLSEQYILSIKIPEGKKVYILRPSMIHGEGNKGNLNLLYKLVKKGLPWPLGSFHNSRSYCSVDNISFIIEKLLTLENIPSSIYHVADDSTLSTNELVSLIAKVLNKKTTIILIPKFLIRFVAFIGDILFLPINSERLVKLTESFIVDNSKIKRHINSELPLTTNQGLIKTIKSFNE